MSEPTAAADYHAEERNGEVHSMSGAGLHSSIHRCITNDHGSVCTVNVRSSLLSLADFGIGQRKRDAEEFVARFKPTYYQKQYRVYGDSVRLIHAYPGAWQVGAVHAQCNCIIWTCMAHEHSTQCMGVRMVVDSMHMACCTAAKFNQDGAYAATLGTHGSCTCAVRWRGTGLAHFSTPIPYPLPWPPLSGARGAGA